MKKTQFTSNIKCQGCIDKVTPVLEKRSDIKSWEVDLTSPERILTVESDELDKDSLVKEIEGVGFKIQAV